MTGFSRFDTIHACDRRRPTDYGIAVAYTRYSLHNTAGPTVAGNAINFKTASRHAGRLFETACLRQTKSSLIKFYGVKSFQCFFVCVFVSMLPFVVNKYSQ